MRNIRIGLAQVRQSCDIDTNVETVLRYLDDAADAGVQIVCFPEAQIPGYRVDICPADTPVQPDRLDEAHATVAQRCSELKIACILGTETPLPDDPTGGKPYNSALVVSAAGEILGVHHKTRLTPLDAVNYSPGTTFETFEIFGVTIGVVICYEAIRFSQTTEECVRQGAQLVFHPQNNTTRPADWKIPVHHALIVSRAAENTIWFASCNICHDDHQNSRSMVVAPNGLIHAQTELKKEELLISDIDIDLATRAMFAYDLEGSVPILFGDEIDPAEYASALEAPER